MFYIPTPTPTLHSAVVHQVTADISFTAPTLAKLAKENKNNDVHNVTIDKAYVKKRMKTIEEKQDLSRYVL